jgi:putative inorganic carbon (hco3(-)) transporter
MIPLPRWSIVSSQIHTGGAGLIAALVLGYAAARVVESPNATFLVLCVAIVLLFLFSAVFGLKRVLLVLAIFGIPFQADKNFFYNVDATAHGAVGGISISLTTLALAGLYTIWIAELLLAPNRTERPRLRCALPAFAYVGLTTASLCVAKSWSLSLNEVALVGQALLLFIYFSSTVRSFGQLRSLAHVLLLTLVLQAALLITQYYSDASFQIAGLRSNERLDETTRVAGTLGSPNSAASFLAPCIAIAVALVVARRARSSRALPTLGIGIGALALVLTFSRGGWLAVTVAVALILGVFSIRRQLTWRVLIIGAVVAVLGSFIGGQIQARLESQTGGLRARAAVGQVATEVIRDYPITGVGANNYVTILHEYAPLTDWAYVPHNKFLLIWSETGIAGLLAFVVFLVTTARRGWLAVRGAPGWLLPYVTALSGAFVALLVHMNFEPFHGRSQLMLLFLVTGLVHAAARLVDEAEHRDKQCDFRAPGGDSPTRDSVRQPDA